MFDFDVRLSECDVLCSISVFGRSLCLSYFRHCGVLGVQRLVFGRSCSTVVFGSEDVVYVFVFSSIRKPCIVP